MQLREEVQAVLPRRPHRVAAAATTRRRAQSPAGDRSQMGYVAEDVFGPSFDSLASRSTLETMLVASFAAAGGLRSAR